MVLSPNEMESRYVREEDKKLKNLEERSFLSFTALPAAIVKKFAVLVRNLVEVIRLVIQYTTVQDNILAARENILRIKLNRLTLADRLRYTFLAFPTASGRNPCLPKTNRRAVCREMVITKPHTTNGLKFVPRS